MTAFDRAQAAHDNATPDDVKDDEYLDEIAREDHDLERAERDAEWWDA